MEWLPWADEPTLGRLIQESRAVILPSHWENFSLAVLGVMAVGAPLIATHVGGTPEVAEHEVNALICPPADPLALLRALQRLLSDPEAAADRAARGAERVRQGFTWDATAARFEQIYQRVLPSLG